MAKTKDQPKDSSDYLYKVRHSSEHIFAQAITELFPKKVKLAVAHISEEGFANDSQWDEPLSEKDFPKIENRMQEIIKANLPIVRKEVSIEKAKEMFSGNSFKLEWIDQHASEGKTITVYWTGDTYVDLCKGPHLDKTGEIGAVKLMSLSGAYWRGDENNEMLTRVYGTAFPTQKELDEYLKNIELAKLHDHRKLGKELELFAISDEVGPGLVLWLPKGNIIKEEIENWAKKIEQEWGYQRVTTPNITKSGLYFTSGHLPYYKADMYPPMTLEDGEEYYLKPMNCPHHHMIYKSKTRSYRDLPLRLAEYGTCYRYEASGELFGLMRVRGFSQNDAHIYCTQEQAVEEFVNVMKLHEFYYKSLGIKDYYLELALRDPGNTKKYHGNEDMWILAEKLMREAVKRVDIPMVETTGSAAFYGPKIDFIIKSSIGREFAISTNQIDLFMGERFNLKYVDNDGSEKTPVIIHRAPLGSHERFIGFLIENFGGNFPLWLSPVQVKILPITERNIAYSQSILEELKLNNIRVELDARNETLGGKIRDAQNEKVPYMLIVGDKEEASGKISIRQRNGKNSDISNLKEFTEKLHEEINSKSIA